MRSLLFLLALCMVTALRAVSIQWTVPNSQHGWFNKETTGVYFVYTQSAVDYKTLAPKVENGVIVPGPGTRADSYGFFQGTLDGNVAGAQAQFTDIPGTSGYYYYMVVYSKTNLDTIQYAVAGGIQYVPKGGSSTGIYDQTVDGEAPEFGDYVDLGWIGGTWKAALVPEPTVLALLALGVAGVALRRKTI